MKRFERFVEGAVTRVIEENMERGWDENVLTHGLLRNLVKQRSFAINHLGARLSVVWDAFFIRQNLQKGNGDILVYVRIQNVEAKTDLTGIGFIEAKRRDWHRAAYGALDQDQLNRILRGHPYAQVLLYNREPFMRGRVRAPLGYAGILPMLVARDLALMTAKPLHAHSSSLGHQLGSRYFFGCDLQVVDPEAPGRESTVLAATLASYGASCILRISVINDQRGTTGSQIAPPPLPPLPDGLLEVVAPEQRFEEAVAQQEGAHVMAADSA